MSRTRLALLLAGLVLAAVPARAAIGFDSTGFKQGSGTSLTAAPAVCGTAGQTILAVIAIRTTTVTVSSVTDPSSDSFTQKAAKTGTNERVEIWSTTVGGASTSQAVTVNLSATSNAVLAVDCYTGVVALGTSNTNTSAAANPSISLTTQDSSNWCVAGFAGQGTGLFTAGTGSLRNSANTTGDGANSNVGGAIVDNTVASPGTCTTSVTNADTDWSLATLELRTSSAGPTCPKTRLMMGVGC